MLQIKLFGSIEFNVNGTEVEVTRPRVRHLAALLALNFPNWVSTDVLIDDLWPGELPKQPRSALQIAASRLRSVFAEAGLANAVESSTSGYRLNQSSTTVDLCEWTNAVDKGLHLMAENNHDGFLELERASSFSPTDMIVPSVQSNQLAAASDEIRQRDVEMRTYWAQSLADRGAWAEALVVGEPAQRRAPLSEALATIVARSLWQIGRQSDALSICACHQAALRDQLGLSPTPEFRRFEESILSPPSQTTRSSSDVERRPWTASEMRTLAAVLRSDESPGAVFFRSEGSTAATFVRDLEDALRTGKENVVRSTGSDLSALLRPTGETTARKSEVVATTDRLTANHDKTILIVDQSESLDEWGLSFVRHATAGRQAVTLVLTGEDPPDSNLLERFEHRTLSEILVPAEPVTQELSPIEIDDPESRKMLEVAAILGRDLDPHLIAELIDRDLAHVAALLERAPEGMLSTSQGRPGTLRFATAGVREALLNSVEPVRHAQVASLAGELVAARRADPLQAAQLLIAGGAWSDEALVARTCESAARYAREKGQYVRASEFFVRAAASAPRDRKLELTADSAECLEFAGMTTESEAQLASILDQIDPEQQLDLLARIAVMSGGHGSSVGGQRQRRRRLAIARNRLPLEHVSHDEVLVEYVSEQLSAISPVDSADVAAVREISINPASPARLLGQRIVLVIDELASRPVDDAAVNDLAVEALRQTSAPAWQRAAALVVPIHLSLVNGNWRDSEGWIDELEFIGRQSGDPRARWQCLAFRSALMSGKGAPKAAAKEAHAALEEGLASRMTDAQTTYAMHQIASALLNGSLAAFAPQLEATGEKYDYRVLTVLRGLAQLDIGNESAAKALLSQARSSKRFGDPYTSAADATTVLLASRLEDEDAVVEASTAMAARSNQFVFCGYGGPYLGPVASYMALAFTCQGEPRLAAEHTKLAQRACSSAGARIPALLRD